MPLRFAGPMVLFALLVPFAAGAAEPAAVPSVEALARDFDQSIRPFVQTYCASCHNPDKPKGDFDLSRYTSVETVTQELPRWQLLKERLEASEMPPAKAKKHPSADERTKVIEWVKSARRFEAHRHAGDPGPVAARRLSNAEFDNTIRDLTGVDLRPAKEFPVDPANEAGFDNSSESLRMTPGLLKKYLQAARDVADHLVMTPEGLEFAPHPVVADTDRDKFCVNRIVAFYRSQPTDFADYFYAAWRYQNRAAMGKPDATLDDIAHECHVSPNYLAIVWRIFNEKAQDVGPIAALQVLWHDLPSGADKERVARAGCERMRDFVVKLRQKLVPKVANLSSPRSNSGSQPLVLWKDRQMAANRRRYVSGGAKAAAGSLPSDAPAVAKAAMEVPNDPEGAKAFDATFERFCSVFPDAFVVSERARVFLDAEKEKQDGNVGRLLSAGFHNQMGFFRDDGPLYELILDDAGRKQLDRLWELFDFVAAIPERQYTNFLWYERAESPFMNAPEFAFARSEDKDCTSDAKMKRLEEVYVGKADRLGAGEVAQQAMHDFFAEFSRRVRWLDKTRVNAEPTHLRELEKFAERAYRRPLSEAQRQGIAAFYRSLRQQDGLNHEDAVRDTLVSILMSPSFCYRLDLPRPETIPATAGGAVQPLDDFALASRLSYFLWASMPDQALLDLAAKGKLHEHDVLVAEAKRMLRDPRARGLATEFAGNWLDFRRFEQHNGVDRERFPTFTSDLRQAMFEEPIRFFLDLAARDGSVMDFVWADYTLVNPVLAKHYGMPVPDHAAPTDWFRVDDARKFGRGGLLPMGVFLTSNSPGLRTSPVKRGNWVVKRILGEHIPPPPPTVPQLPTDESKLELSLRDTLAKHRADPSCAACHERFDSMGLVFEGYGPVGERRDKDLGGKPVDSSAIFPGGSEGTGLPGLLNYVRARRQNDFVDQLCRQLLAYGLGRTLLPSDDELLESMRSRLEANGYRFGELIDAIVTSPQFRSRRANVEVTRQ
jgi:mono/diheme cytochrome c family protein